MTGDASTNNTMQRRSDANLEATTMQQCTAVLDHKGQRAGCRKVWQKNDAATVGNSRPDHL